MAVKIGLVGTGTVGGGCIDIIQKHKDDFLRHFGVDIELARVCSLSSAEAEAHGVGHLFTDNFNNIINDPEIDIVVELIGADIRPNCIDALQKLVGHIKNELVVEKEIFA